MSARFQPGFPAGSHDHTVAGHTRATMRLAGPVILSRVSILAIFAVDTAMTGHVGAQELAFYGLAIAPQVPLLLIGLGLLMGTSVLTAQAVGANEPRACGRVLWVALAHAGVAGAILLAACYAGEAFLRLTGQSAFMAAGAGDVVVALGWGLPAALLYAVGTFFLEGINRPVPGMVVMLVANVLNAFLNWVLIFGHLGVDPMGAQGAAVATSIVRWFAFVGIGAYILVGIDQHLYGIRRGSREGRPVGMRLRRLGLPLSIAHGLESAAFSTMTLFAGWLGPLQVSSYQIAINLISLVFMGAVGLGSAGSVRVGNAVGRGDMVGMRMAGWTAIGLAIGLTVVFATAFAIWPESLASVYASDPAIIALAAPAITIAAFALIADGAHGAIMGVLRGTADVWPATYLYLLSFWGVMVPCGYYLGVVRGAGAAGLMVALLLGAIVATVLLALRFRVVTRRLVVRT